MAGETAARFYEQKTNFYDMTNQIMIRFGE